PNVQLLATTHSPLIAASVELDEVIQFARNRQTRRVEVRRDQISRHGRDADEILTGPLFELPDTPSVGTQRRAARSDEIRALTSPTPEQIEERKALAQELFGERAPQLSRSTAKVLAAIEESVAEKVEAQSEEDKARVLAETEKLVERLLARS